MPDKQQQQKQKQMRITSFFDNRSSSAGCCSEDRLAESSEDYDLLRTRDISVTYQRRKPESTLKRCMGRKDEVGKKTHSDPKGIIADADRSLTVPHTKHMSLKRNSTECVFPGEQSVSRSTTRTSVPLDDAVTSHGQPERITHRKRVYNQYFLELGQKNFLLSSCEVCGLSYSCGDTEDEKIHKSFHKRYLQGVEFKGWQTERIVTSFSGMDRVILVMDGDPPHHHSKVKEVLMMIEKEMGLVTSWVFHKLCKVYLYISSNRITGCLVSEPIKCGFRVVSEQHRPSMNKENRKVIHENESSNANGSVKPRNKNILDFRDSCYTYQDMADEKNVCGSEEINLGIVKFRRETAYKNVKFDLNDNSGAVVCSDIPIPASCGIRAIWVLPSKRRKGIATKLLDAMRKTFCIGCVLELSQCAFSQPTYDGKLLAASYCNTFSFLVYKSNDLDPTVFSEN